MIENETRELSVNFPICILEKYDQIRSTRPADDQNLFESFFMSSMFLFRQKEENNMIHLHISK